MRTNPEKQFPSNHLIVLALTLLAGCAQPLLQFSTDTPATVLAIHSSTNVRDERASFRNYFCNALKRDGAYTDKECVGLLHRLPDEPPQATAASPIPLEGKLELLIVPGIFGECIQDHVTIFGDAMAHMARFGYHSSTVNVRGRASSEHNAKLIRDHIIDEIRVTPNKRFLLLAYSKGTPDALVALSKYPELHKHVAALISFAGVVNGTPLADSLEDWYEHTVGKLPYAKCPKIDEDEVRSLTRAERMNWLSTHTLPKTVAYFSVVALPSPDRVSEILRPMHGRLSSVDPRNDSQVIYYDAVIPGSTLLGYANADHWAIALPFESQAPALAATFVNRNHFPRAQLVEAAVSVAEEQLRKRDIALRSRD